MSQPRTWDIFCKVVDNYGDAAVCWRLARQLAAEHGAAVRLWISDLAPLHALWPEVRTGTSSQRVEAVEVQAWCAGWGGIRPAEIVVEAFGCGLPDDYVRAMASAAPHPLWVVLEYLSAEAWVAEHHGLPSPHPRSAIPRYFFFPGFAPGTGGVLREAGLVERRNAFGRDERRNAWKSLGFEPPEERATVISVFAYDDAPVVELVSAWQSEQAPMVVSVPHGKLASRIGAHYGFEASAGMAQRLGGSGVEMRVLPFVAQPRYDELLWTGDCNFVRGEDSFVRAQHAGLPFIWNIYPQAERAHWRKLMAFLAVYCQGLERSAAAALETMWRAWNGATETPLGVAWREYRAQRHTLARHAGAWASRLEASAELAANLAKFCADRVKY